jgi:hypothetical protein
VPILEPNTGTLRFRIQDIEQCVIRKVENRQTDVALVDEWLRDALIELSSNPDYRDDFDQLQVLGPVSNLVAPVGTTVTQEYDESQFLPATTPATINKASLDFMLWADPPTNVQRRQLKPSNFQDADQFMSTSISASTPVEWYRFGSTIGFNPPPNQAYQVQARFLQFHPINDDNLNQTIILLPREWNEVLCWAAAERGFMELLEYEKAMKIHQLLFGDPKHPDKPGLIYGVKKRLKQEAWRQQQGLRPIIRGYSYGSY